LGELERIREFLGCEPLRMVENPEGLSPEELFQLFLPDIVPESERRLLTGFFRYKYRGETVPGEDEDRFSDLVRADAVMGEELLPSIVSKLRQLSKYMKFSGEVLTSEQFRQTLQDMVYDYRVRLDSRDLKILNMMRENVLTSIKSIADRLGWSYTTTHRRVKRLEERCRLGVFPRLNYSRIGLTHLLVLTEGEAHVESPYLLSRHELLGGDMYNLFSIVVPPRAVNKVCNDFERKLPRVWTWIVEGFEGVITFDFYDVDREDWSIDWNSWSLFLSHVLSKGWDKVIPPEGAGEPSPLPETPSGGEDITKRDLEFIDVLLHRFDVTTKDLSLMLGYGERTTARDRRSLIERGIIQPCLSIDHIGLNENILLIVESDAETLNSFAVAIRRLPKAWIYRMRTLDGESALACWLEAPPGSITPLERAVRRTLRPLARYKIFFRSNQEGSGAPLIELYDLQSRAWKWSPKMLKIIPKRGKEE